MMPTVESELVGEGHDVRQQLHQLAAVLPVAQHLLHGPVRAQPRRARQLAARRRLHQVQRHQHAAAVAAGGRLPHDPHRQVPERLRDRDQRPGLRAARLGRVVRGRRRHAPSRSTTTSSTRTARSISYGDRRSPTSSRTCSPTSPSTRSTATLRGGPFFMGVMYTAPHSGGPNPNPNPPTNCGATAKPAPRATRPRSTPSRCRAAELQRGRRLRQAGRDPGDAIDHRPRGADIQRTLPLPARVAAVGRRRRQADHRRAQRRRRARRHADRVHLRQRLLPRRAPGPIGQEPRLRGGDPGPAGDPRARRSPPASPSTTCRSTPTWRRRSSMPPGRPPGWPRTAARCCPSRPIPTASTAASC